VYAVKCFKHLPAVSKSGVHEAQLSTACVDQHSGQFNCIRQGFLSPSVLDTVCWMTGRAYSTVKNLQLWTCRGTE